MEGDYVNNFTLVNADTDSISFCKKDGSKFSEKEQERLLKDLNSLFAEKINWDHDGIFKTVIVVKAKNYVMDDGKKVVIKGSALKATMKEPALKSFLKETVDLMLQNKVDKVGFLYQDYVEKICKIQSIDDWCSKKTITKNVLYPKRTTEQRILDAVEGEKIQEGDKIHVFFERPDKLTIKKNFNGVYHRPTLHGKLFNTVKIMENVLDMTQFPNYKLKGKQKDLLKMGLIDEVQ